ncbi:hypothetical protein Nepgr_024593 [Nepenthes gracilis]|uniref:AT-hook motif nuclear-localized protein n=1 Tax=Nepenthes gracilis TaxID=150966 RepID=A0AAD3T4G8_NEPGR|nr:hypothetical protein Nepgr_024593 [Nepenthes gracilis]
MEAKEGTIRSGGVTVVGADAPTDYRILPRSGNANHFNGSTLASGGQVGVQPPMAAAGTVVKKKRGRPRKYAPDGSVSMVLSPKPISSSAPPQVIDFSRRAGLAIKQQKNKFETDNLGEWVSFSVGDNFTPHIIAVNAGEDVTMKVISFSQVGPRAICILSANGVISSVTLRHPDSSGGTLTYEGRFEILTLTGSFMPSESGGIRNRSGGMSISLVSHDGRVVGGAVAGLLVAAGPVQIVVGSFLARSQHEGIPK